MQIIKLGVKSLYPEHKVSSMEVVFHFLAAYSINLEKEVAKILEDKKARERNYKKIDGWFLKTVK